MIDKKVKKPKKEVNAAFYAPGSDIPVTEEEIKRRKRREARIEAIGGSMTRVTSGMEHENPYRAEAMIYILKDEDVPQELLDKIKEYDLKCIQQAEKK